MNMVSSFVKCQLAIGTVLLAAASWAETPVFEVKIQNHLFQPDTLVIPAHTKIKLIIHNLDSTPEEFESYELNREKVIVGGGRGVVFIGPLSQGKYAFFGDFNPQTAVGTIVVGDVGDVVK